MPEFANLRALPAAHWRVRTLRWHWMSITILNRPMANLGTVEPERVQPQGFGGHKAIGTGRRAAKALFKKAQNRCRPARSMIATGTARRPYVGALVSAGSEVFSAQRIETTAGNFKLVGCLGGAEP